MRGLEQQVSEMETRFEQLKLAKMYLAQRMEAAQGRVGGADGAGGPDVRPENTAGPLWQRLLAPPPDSGSDPALALAAPSAEEPSLREAAFPAGLTSPAADGSELTAAGSAEAAIEGPIAISGALMQAREQLTKLEADLEASTDRCHQLEAQILEVSADGCLQLEAQSDVLFSAVQRQHEAEQGQAEDHGGDYATVFQRCQAKLLQEEQRLSEQRQQPPSLSLPALPQGMSPHLPVGAAIAGVSPSASPSSVLTATPMWQPLSPPEYARRASTGRDSETTIMFGATEPPPATFRAADEVSTPSATVADSVQEACEVRLLRQDVGELQSLVKQMVASQAQQMSTLDRRLTELEVRLGCEATHTADGTGTRASIQWPVATPKAIAHSCRCRVVAPSSGMPLQASGTASPALTPPAERRLPERPPGASHSSPLLLPRAGVASPPTSSQTPCKASPPAVNTPRFAEPRRSGSVVVLQRPALSRSVSPAPPMAQIRASAATASMSITAGSRRASSPLSGATTPSQGPCVASTSSPASRGFTISPQIHHSPAVVVPQRQQQQQQPQRPQQPQQQPQRPRHRSTVAAPERRALAQSWQLDRALAQQSSPLLLPGR